MLTTASTARIDFIPVIRYSPAMPSNIDPSALVNIPCPKLWGEDTADRGHNPIVAAPSVPSCGTTFAVNARKVLDTLRAVEEQAELERRRRGL